MLPSEPKLTDQRKSLDIFVYNDSTRLCVSSSAMHERENSRLGQRRAAEKELMMSMQLSQDDSMVIRTRLGRPTRREEGDWITRTTGILDLSDGLLFCNTVAVEVPPKRYFIDIRCHFPFDTACWHWEQSGKENDRLGSYWRQTRGDATLPDWLRWMCLEEPALDPGHEEEWRLQDYEEPHSLAFIDFVICLLPVTKRSRATPLRADGVSPWEVRRPTKCPLGIPAANVLGCEEWDDEPVDEDDDS